MYPAPQNPLGYNLCGQMGHIYMSAGIKECLASTLTHGATSSPYVFVDQDYNSFRNLSFFNCYT